MKTSGRVGSAKTPKKWAGLMGLAANFVEPPKPGEALPPVRIVWPDGTAVSSDGGDSDARLSETLGRPVTLTTGAPGGAQPRNAWTPSPKRRPSLISVS